MSTKSTRSGDKPIPNHAHPLVRRFMTIANQRALSMRQIGKKSGIHHGVISSWGNRSNPRIDNLEAALNAVGFTLKIVERRA